MMSYRGPTVAELRWDGAAHHGMVPRPPTWEEREAKRRDAWGAMVAAERKLRAEESERTDYMCLCNTPLFDLLRDCCRVHEHGEAPKRWMQMKSAVVYERPDDIAGMETKDDKPVNAVMIDLEKIKCVQEMRLGASLFGGSVRMG